MVEEHILKPSEGALGVDGPALEEHIAVALEVVARRTRPQTNATFGQVHQVRELRGAAAGRRVGAILACQLAELALVHHRGHSIACQETLVQVPLQAYRTGALAIYAQLKKYVIVYST